MEKENSKSKQSNFRKQFPKMHFCLFLLNLVIAVLSIIIGAIAIESSMKVASLMDAYDELKNITLSEEQKIVSAFYYTNVIIGSILLVMSLFFIWIAVDYGLLVLYKPGQPYLCAYQKYLIKDTKQNILEKLNRN